MIDWTSKTPWTISQILDLCELRFYIEEWTPGFSWRMVPTKPEDSSIRLPEAKEIVADRSSMFPDFKYRIVPA